MTENKDKCVFCEILVSRSENILFEDSVSYVIFDKNPFNRGHLLIVSKVHVEDVFSSIEISKKLFELTAIIGRKLSEQNICTGVSIYQNNNKGSKTHIDHLHFHLVPIFSDDNYTVITNSTFSQTQKVQSEQIIRELLNVKIEYVHSELTFPLFKESGNMISENIEDISVIMNRDSVILDQEVENWYNRYLSKEDIVVLAKTENGNVVCSAHVRRYERRKNHCGKLSIIVDRNFRGMSVGTKTLEKLKTLCIKNNVSRIEAEPSTMNTRAINFLMENGFEIESIQKKKLKIKDGVFRDCYLMSLEL